MSDIRCIGIATGGGDAPGLNAVIRAATKAAIVEHKWKVVGIPDGFDGLIWPEKSFELTRNNDNDHHEICEFATKGYQGEDLCCHLA